MNDITRSALLTDLYQLTMMQTYVERNMQDTAVFEFFVRKLPKERNFLLAAGLEQVLGYLENLSFTTEELTWLRHSGRFKPQFLDYLQSFRFSGDVHAMVEGTIFFANEPILRVTAPLPQAQLIESRIINILHLQTLLASKAVRSVLAAPQNTLLVDFGLRRAHGAEAGLYAARASYLAGFSGSATVLAGMTMDIPIFGTMAHSYIQAHADEISAFEHFALSHEQNVILLIDTYDTEAAAHKVVALAPQLAQRGITIKGVRIDSGDLGAHALQVRAILDAAGLSHITIFASGSLDEYLIQSLTQARAPINGYGVGTHMDTSSDAPYLDCAYKLQEYAGTARRKRSEGKATWPGRKQVYRRYDRQGLMQEDILTTELDDCRGQALIQPVMRHGQRLHPATPLADIRHHVQHELTRLPAALRQLSPAPAYPVTVSAKLQALAQSLDQIAH